MSEDDLIVKTLHELIEACKDCEYDFSLCARYTSSEELREHYVARAKRCKRTAQELRMHVIQYGGKGDLTGSTAGALHRGWLTLRGTLFGRNDHTWLQECSRTDLMLMTRLRHAMKKAVLPPGLQIWVERQFHAWQHLHGQIRLLKGLARVPT